jgi:hypothetical protein
LYSVEYGRKKVPHTIHLLALKHHLQLSFDLQRFIH